MVRFSPGMSGPGTFGGSSGSRQARSIPSHRKPVTDDEATARMLHTILLSKNVGEDPFAEMTGISPAGRDLPDLPSPTNRTASANSITDPAVGGLSMIELETERQAFIAKTCCPSTRFDVQEWVGKIFDMNYKAKLVAAQKDAKERRRRRLRSSTAMSDSGASGQTSQTGVTGTTGTALHTVGGSIAASQRPPRSLDSDESLVVHHSGGDEPLSIKERIQAFLAGRIPELEAHVNAHIAANTDALQRKVDEELAEQYLRTTQQRKVFDGRANYLRWQNARHQVLQKQLDASMPRWILEAIENWDQKKSAECKAKDISDTDLIFEYLTKRAAHIDSGKLPTDVPIFKALHASYSLPSMWKDKYYMT